MQIPQPGADILYTLQPSSPADNRPAETRPGKITKVWSYGPSKALCNILVYLDHGDRQRMAANMPPSAEIEGFQMMVTSVEYDPKGGQWTWQYMPAQEFQCLSMTVRADIQHGRETIKAGAVGVYDQMRDTITFDRAEVDGLHQDHKPAYPGMKFCDQHCARIDTPEGWTWTLSETPNDGTEWSDERRRTVESVRRRAEAMFNLPHFQMFSRMFREMGMPMMPMEMMVPPIWRAPLDKKEARPDQQVGRSPVDLKMDEGNEMDTSGRERRMRDRNRQPAGAE